MREAIKGGRPLFKSTAPSNELKDRIYNCRCQRCRAVVNLIKRHGATIQFSEGRAGRLCELAVVAGAGAEGIDANEVVRERRRYAVHIGVELCGPTSNSDDPIHICHAIDRPRAQNRINLGSAQAWYSNGRYFLR